MNKLKQRGMLLNPFRFAAGDSDPYWSNVILLCPFEGSAGSTAFSDSSSTPKSLAAVGDAKHSAAQSKFGSTSLGLDGDGDYVSIGAHSALALGTGDMTLEAWVWLQSSGNTADRNLFVQTGSGGVSWGLINGYLQLGANSVAYDITSSALVPVNSWVYLGARRASGAISQCINGVIDGSATLSRNYSATSGYYIGGQPAGQSINAFIGQLRITKGVARDITKVPMARFPTK